jgi:predicted O-linked N-acetylglucosamine transferase (SPINDLY family)
MQPQFFLAQCINAAHTANARGEFSVAVGLCKQALHHAPELPEAWYNLGVALRGLGNRAEAIAALERARSRTLNTADAQNNIGLQLIELRALAEAERCLDRALVLTPHYAFAHSNMGKLRVKQQRFDDAESSFRKAIQLQPDLAVAYVNLGGALNSKRDFVAADAACRKATELDPRLPDAWRNRANALAGLKHYGAAAECCERCLELDPNAKFIRGAMLHNRMKICDWASFERDLDQLLQSIEKDEKASYPFPVLGLTGDPASQRRAAEVYAADEFPPNPDLGPIAKRSRHDRIRVGYYSADFRNHVVSILMAEVFELHDKSRFDLFGFAFGPESQDEMRQRVSAAFGTFMDVRNKSDREIAELSRELEIDIAIDLGGFTEGCRMGIFSMRAAPIQVSYIGYLGTVGTPYIDYLIADRTIVPREQRLHYTEKIACIPSYQANDSKRLVSDRIFTREELGLPSNGFVFCNFNNNYKITLSTFGGWMRILKEVDGSVLFLYADNDASASNLRKEAERRGIDASRIVFGARLPTPEYLARYRVVDLFLDTHPYNAGTTASDALWLGVPLVTYMGESFASRVAASLLNAIGLPELITTSQEEYEGLAVELATSPQKLARIREKLATNRLSTLLFDTPVFTRNLEAVYTSMYERQRADLPPEDIDIDR